jgi:hypothetical protein
MAASAAAIAITITVITCGSILKWYLAKVTKNRFIPFNISSIDIYITKIFLLAITPIAPIEKSIIETNAYDVSDIMIVFL